jgi:prepilin-type N-terminal cleavage/methylation domain-containing protein
MKKNIPNTKYQIPNTKFGFTLIEIMVAIGIMGILAAVVLVSMKSFAAKGRSAKALAQISSAIPAMYSCRGDGGTFSDPSSGSDICSTSSYGKWPSVTDYSINEYSAPFSDSVIKDDWLIVFRSDSSHDNVKICCNARMKSCGIVGDASVECLKTTTW